MKSQRTAVLMTLIAAALWGSSFPIIKLGLELGLDPMSFAAVRFSLTAALMFAFFRATRRSPEARAGAVRVSPLVLLLGAINGLAFVLQYLAQARTSATHAALVIGAGLPLTALTSAIVLKERVGWRRLLTVPVAMAGVFLVVTDGDWASLQGGDLLGDVLAFGAALCWVAYLVIFKSRFNEEEDVLGLTFWVFVVSAVIAWLSVPWLGSFAWPAGISAWGVILYTAIFCSIVPFVLFSRAIQGIPATVSSVLLSFETVAAVILSVLWFDESLSLLGWFGASAIVLSTLVVARPN
jgi:drug/metabolite transporter (DMT)-like permease